jgi:hypothetical protein
MSSVPLLLLLSFVLFLQVSAQIEEIPWRPNSTQPGKLKGAVHTVLTIEQRYEKVFSTVIEVYDMGGRLIETTSSNSSIEIHSGKLIRLGGKSVFSYDASGKLIKAKHFSPEGEHTGHTAYVYDSKNRLTEETGYSSGGKVRNKTTYTSLPERRAVEVTWQVFYEDRTSQPVKKLVFQNDKGQFIKLLEQGSPANDTVTFEYDLRGYLEEELHCCKYNYSHRFTYKFDKQGNWIERENTYVQLDDKGKEVISPGWMSAFRVITYYADHETKPKQ